MHCIAVRFLLCSNPVEPIRIVIIMVNKKEKEAEEKSFDIFKNRFVPKHEILNPEEKTELLKKLNITLKQLPRMKEEDPGVKAVGAKHGDVVRITRKSQTAGEYFYYRVVV